MCARKLARNNSIINQSSDYRNSIFLFYSSECQIALYAETLIIRIIYSWQLYAYDRLHVIIT